MRSIEWRHFQMTLDDPKLHQTTPFSTFSIAFHIFLLGDHRDFKFGTWVDLASVSPEMGVVRSREPCTFWLAPTISLKQLQLQLSNFVHK